ncbi:hypothetical protein [Variovorax saccharolyticus]|uniref:hypothetical protein n=1 Tax=Variovorax saccharolyticus TaxID=3053516 RepID=UPI0025762A45|nr:hypothetical protein [Variovorax sp. J31P216]MDM0029599.1 hypothetical protein [Variovorax sp. J31P216]
MTTSLPPPDDAAAIFEFAMTFDGYAHFGSVERSAAEAGMKRRASREDVMNELFFEARASRHRDDDDYVALYAELLPHLKRFAG